MDDSEFQNKKRDFIALLRAQGYAVVIFSPFELKNAPAKEIESELVFHGNEVIAFHNS